MNSSSAARLINPDRKRETRGTAAPGSLDEGRPVSCSTILAAKGYTDLGTFEYFGANAVGNPEAFVVFSETSLIQHPKRGYVHNQVKVRVRASGEVVVEARYLDPVTYEVTMEEKFFTRIADEKEGAARFFRVD